MQELQAQQSVLPIGSHPHGTSTDVVSGTDGVCTHTHSQGTVSVSHTHRRFVYRGCLFLVKYSNLRQHVLSFVFLSWSGPLQLGATQHGHTVIGTHTVPHSCRD